jgi:hypothetical protein
MEFVKGTEAHPSYHTFCALIALSSIVSRRVWVDQGHYQVYPNMYVVLVGPPGNRKTSAMNVCKDLLRDVSDIPFSAECQTKESLVKELVTYERIFTPSDPSLEGIKYTPMTICVTELSQFLGAASAHMIDFLTTIYDSKHYDVKTKNKGSETVTGPYIVLLGCTTPAWITARLRDDVISGGFSRRALFIYEWEKVSRITFPHVSESARQAWTRLVDYGIVLKKVHGPMRWTADAMTFYDSWYQKLVIPTDPTISGYFESKHDQLLKIATLISLSENLEMRLEQQHLEMGLELLQLVEKNLSRVFEGIGRNELNSVAAKIVDILNHGMLPEKKLQSIMYREASGDELYKIIQHLQQTDKIERLQVETPGQPTRYFLRVKAPSDVASSPSSQEAHLPLPQTSKDIARV